jgi:transcriptional regulator with XRE-family HTH domain
MKNKKENNITYMNVGENIRTWRKIKGIEQKDLAQMIDKSVTTISNIETGVSDPNTKLLQDIASALQIEPSQLLINPSQMISFTNSPQSNAIVYGNATQQTTDKDILDRLTNIMEKMASFFTSKDKGK